jgi:hypothetical protein
MKDQFQLIAQVVLIGLGPVLAKHGVTVGNNDVDQILGGLSLLVGIIWKFVHWNTTPSAVPATVPIKQVVSCLAFAAVFAGIVGCAPLQPGADPIVVRCEQTETIAQDTFDQVLAIDNGQRDFYRTNAPAFHSFCEWLRVPQTVEGTNTLPRASAMLVSLDDVKLAYKAGRASSNSVYTALQTVTSAMGQANAWLSNGPQLSNP